MINGKRGKEYLRNIRSQGRGGDRYTCMHSEVPEGKASQGSGKRVFAISSVLCAERVIIWLGDCIGSRIKPRGCCALNPMTAGFEISFAACGLGLGQDDCLRCQVCYAALLGFVN